MCAGSWPIALFLPAGIFFVLGSAVFVAYGRADQQDFSDTSPLWCATSVQRHLACLQEICLAAGKQCFAESVTGPVHAADPAWLCRIERVTEPLTSRLPKQLPGQEAIVELAGKLTKQDKQP